MTLRLVIAEKPSVAQTIAAVLGVKEKKNEYIEGGGCLISWCVGHLIQLTEVAAYGEQYKEWSFGSLPILPRERQYTVDPDKGKQSKTLKESMHHADVFEVINACDAGCEEELIFRFIYETAGCKGPMRRLWISSMEDGVIKVGFASLKDGRECDALSAPAFCHARADWLISINATRLFSCLYGKASNVGRVQTPTLKMPTDRDVAISHLQREKHYHARPDLSGAGATSERISDKAEAAALKGACETQTAVCVSLTREKKAATPSRLFGLTSLQREANRIFGYTVKQALDLAQALYEEWLLTYPRTDNSFLTDDMGGTAAGIIVLLCEKLPLMAGADLTSDIAEVSDSKKVSDHHATIPTMELARADPDVLSESERNILTLVGVCLLLAIAEPHIFEAATVAFSCADTEFMARGKTVLSGGWREIGRRYRVTLRQKPEAEDGENEGVTLPELSEGQGFPNPIVKVTEHTTTSSKPHSEASLLSAMERAGNGDINPDTERQGFGTPIIRAAVIEKLVKGDFTECKGKQPIPTQNGVALIPVPPDMLTSPQFTVEWENNLMQIAKGATDPGELLLGIEAMAWEPVRIYAAVQEDKKGLSREEKPSIGKCPRCGPPVHERKKNYYYSNRECAFVTWRNDRFFEERKVAFLPKIAAALLRSGKASVKKLYSPEIGKTYDGTIVLADTGGKYVNYRIEVQKN